MEKIKDLHQFLWSFFLYISIIPHIIAQSVFSDATYIDDMTAICSSQKLVVKGNDIKISDVLNVTCIKNSKFVEIFALNKLIFDADINKTGQNAEMSIIAPTWEIIDERKIILDGKKGKSHSSIKASDGIGSFRHGKPGLPGGSGGCFFGIGNDFINGANLKIHINGGLGGPGQNGAKGLSIFISILHTACLLNLILNKFLSQTKTARVS